MATDKGYEWLRDEIAALGRADDPSRRRLVWVTAEQSLAVARDAAGRIEVFVDGGPLVAATAQVAAVLEHQVWESDERPDLSAARVVLPTGEHFDQVAALVCVELVAHGLEENRQGAFSAVEPLLALALTRESVTDLTLIGLIGELTFMETLLLEAEQADRGRILDGWAGSEPSARDFELGSVGVEVKTTQGASSTHHVAGVHQVELGRSNDDVLETDLFMLSLGIGWTTENQGRSLPELLDGILGLVGDHESRTDLLARVKQYGGDAALGYDHEKDRGKARYAARFHFRFERLYDMTDDRIELLTSANLADLRHIDPGSVEFRVVLGERIRGDANPTTGAQPIAHKVLAAAGLPVT